MRSAAEFGMIAAMTKADSTRRLPVAPEKPRAVPAGRPVSDDGSSKSASGKPAGNGLSGGDTSGRTRTGQTPAGQIPTDHERLLREAGVRITRQRRTILSILAECGGDHPDAVEIFRRASAIDPTISLSTVYRTMKLLEEKGAIQRHVFEGGPARFEGADGIHHDHLIDLDTGDVVEFRSERIERLQEEIASELGYEIVSHRLELYGRTKKDE